MNNVLLLNASWEPLCIVTRKRAIGLMFSGKVDVVSEDANDLIRSASQAFSTPHVLRLRRYVSVPYYSTARLTKRNVLLRDGSVCSYCKRHANTIDHVIPRSAGGEHVWENVVAACENCNNKKGSKLLSQIGWQLSTTPAKPSQSLWLLAAIGVEKNSYWEPYVQNHVKVAV